MGHGRILGRLPTEELLEEWTKKVVSNPWGPSPMPTRQLEEKLKECVMKALPELRLRYHGRDAGKPEIQAIDERRQD